MKFKGDSMNFNQKPVLYISGPFSAQDPIHAIEMNILKASQYALEAWEKGWAVLCPHKNTQGFQHSSLGWSVLMDGDISFLDRLQPEKGDAILMLPGWEASEGAKLEEKFANINGLRVIYYEKEGIPVAFI